MAIVRHSVDGTEIANLNADDRNGLALRKTENALAPLKKH
ncbi:hypothetical protein Oter_4466 [Opitutus terrae PB90-1]|uniref:Uncharacterized protein n=1 Tax=Opitutus terrae (strain DSM 11246 / JCM 15787 / PB90-1) TaxID=452637 RepID=B1ZQ18_OPITP|nr:hypothetical protein Oter_4466 [Opitutus terrae PB90-1]